MPEHSDLCLPCMAVHLAAIPPAVPASAWPVLVVQREEGEEEAEARLGRVMGHRSPRIDAGPPQFELKRVCTTGLFGAAFVGPLGHYWYVSSATANKWLWKSPFLLPEQSTD